ncbi:MAG: hypothetical protein HYV90_05580 [Candidatus Woesebacteria bacterium]|nr:MAG: hypothetical protein HYV90_05580 [Candidatus Woesebacteria bacterium]
MAIEIFNEGEGKDEESNFFPEVVRETTEQGRIVWLKSAPEDSKPPVNESSLQSNPLK